jgi:hypothetical protein
MNSRRCGIGPFDLRILVIASVVSVFAACWCAVVRADDVLATIYSFSGTGTVDLLDPSANTDTGPLITGLNGPSGIAFGTDGSVYVSEEFVSPGDVQRYSLTYTNSGPTATYVNTLPLPADSQNAYIVSAGGVRVGPNGSVYVTDFQAAYNPAGAALFQFSGTTGAFQGSAVTGLTSATGMAFDNAGNIYISDFGTQGLPNGQVIKYNPSSSTQTTIIVSGSGPQSTPLANPEGLVLLPNGNLLVGDAEGNGLQGNLLEYTTSGASVSNSVWPGAAAAYNQFLQNENSNFAFFPGSMTLTPNGQDVLVANLGGDFVDGNVVEFDLKGNVLKSFATGIASDVAVLASPAVTWNSVASAGLYSNGTNWSGPTGTTSAPSGAGTNATFGTGGGGVVIINGQFTVGTLAFNSTTEYILQGADGTSSITMDNNGLGAMITVPSGGQTHAINTNLVLTDIGTTAFNVGSGSNIDIGGAITGSGALALTGGGNLIIGLGGSIGNFGGTTIENGQLQVLSTASISGPVTLMVAYGYNGELDLFAPSISLASLTSSTDSVLGTTATVNVAAGSALSTPALSVTGTLNFNSAMSATGSIAIDGPPTFADASQLNVNAGTVRINSETSGWSVGSGVTITVATGATLQLANSGRVIFAARPAPASNLVNIDNQGSTASGGGLFVLDSSQSVGVIGGTATPSGGVTVYDGDTTVGYGSIPASLTATQILQNSLTINAGSAVTITPSGSGTFVGPDGASTAAELATAGASAAPRTASGDAADSSEPFSAIQAAIASGAISSAKGTLLENRIAAIEELAATDPGLDVSLLESRVLASLPSASLWSNSPLLEQTGSGLLNSSSADLFASDSGASESGAAAAFGSIAGMGGSPAAVPEPATLLLAAMGGVGVALAARRRRIWRSS